MQLDPHHATLSYHQAIHRIDSALTKVFRRQKDRAIARAGHLAKLRMFKSPDDDSSEYNPGLYAEEISNDIFEVYRELPPQIRPALEDAMLSGINTGILQLELHDTKLIAAANHIAADFASERAAELVGMKYDADGELVPNPNAEWAISDTTRDKIKRIVVEAFEGETKIGDVAAKIQEALKVDEAGIFSDARAKTIANTEVANSQAGGNWEVWKRSGLVKSVRWQTSNLEPCDECEDNKNVEVDFGEAFPSGDILPPAHPNCRCVLVAVKIGDDE
jgi:hypothetical protein